VTIPSITQVVRIGEVVVGELNSFTIEADIVDQDGNPVAAAAVDSLTLTIYNDVTDGIINSRNAANVLNANGGTYHATSGNFKMEFRSADSPIVDTTLLRGAKETHTARFTMIWDSGLKRWDGEVRIKVIQLNKVP
jgi:hypothetical protein